jgi:CheY-like chemotaxis protein
MVEKYRIVLVVDDEPEVREYAAQVLRTHGFLVAAAANAEAALEILQNVIVDVLFTDIVMPGRLDGLALAGRARRLQPRIRVVCATGFARIEDDAALDLCRRLLRKPYRPQQLITEIDGALATE